MYRLSFTNFISIFLKCRFSSKETLSKKNKDKYPKFIFLLYFRGHILCPFIGWLGVFIDLDRIVQPDI
jgi:hypothetical protein